MYLTLALLALGVYRRPRWRERQQRLYRDGYRAPGLSATAVFEFCFLCHGEHLNERFCDDVRFCRGARSRDSRVDRPGSADVQKDAQILQRSLRQILLVAAVRNV